MTTTTPNDDNARTGDLANVPTELRMKIRTSELVDELLRHGMSIEELCSQVGVSGPDELFALVEAADESADAAGKSAG